MKNILICPLEWGLGHAGRMIALAGRLSEMNHNIFIGSGKEHLSFFENEMPGLSYINFPGFKPGYSVLFPQYLVLLLQTPLMIYHIISEHIKLKRIINRYKIDIIISDNRFGLWNRKVKTVYVTHMPRIPFPAGFRWLEGAGVWLHRLIIRKYSLCFIPDLPGEVNVSGRLSHGVRLPENAMFIGILSRFSITGPECHTRSSACDYNTVILSGPEPQRSILRQKLARLFEDNKLPTVFLEGRPGKGSTPHRSGNMLSYNHLSAPEMKEMILGSRNIVSRSGYTSVMELISLKRSALLIPTPGQPEQEYLAASLSAKGWFSSISQKELKGTLHLSANNSSLPEQIAGRSRELFENALEILLNN